MIARVRDVCCEFRVLSTFEDRRWDEKTQSWCCCTSVRPDERGEGKEEGSGPCGRDGRGVDARESGVCVCVLCVCVWPGMWVWCG